MKKILVPFLAIFCLLFTSCESKDNPSEDFSNENWYIYFRGSSDFGVNFNILETLSFKPNGTCSIVLTSKIVGKSTIDFKYKKEGNKLYFTLIKESGTGLYGSLFNFFGRNEEGENKLVSEIISKTKEKLVLKTYNLDEPNDYDIDTFYSSEKLAKQNVKDVN